MIIPYGYKMKDGETVIDEKEAANVKRIFEQYKSGSSLLDIARDFTERKIIRHDGESEWNKNRIKRIIEDVRYLGNEEYPKIIEKELYDCLQLKKVQKTTFKKSEAPTVTKSLAEKLYCMECGEALGKNRNGYYCQNGCIKTVKKDELTDMAKRIIARIKDTPDLTEKENFTMLSIDTMRLTNEINRKLEQGVSDSDELMKLIFKAAEAKYYEASKTENYLIEMHKEFLMDSIESEILDTDILFRITRDIHIDKSGSCALRLVNGKSAEL